MLIGDSAMATEGAGDSCLRAKVERLHKHWHDLVTTQDLAVRAEMLREHRQLVDSFVEFVKTDEMQRGAGCKSDTLADREDLAVMVEMHGLMLDMTEQQ
jgi:hypothetical protein